MENMKVASVDKEAGFKDFFSSVMFATSLLFGGSSLSEASEKSGIPVQIIKSIDFDKMKGMTNEQKKQYVDGLKGVAKKPSESKQSPVILPEKMSISDVLARTIYAEAEGESYEGKKAVASVIYNRANGDVGKMTSVVKERKQFSCWNDGPPPRGHGDAWNDSLKIAKELIGGNFVPTTKHTHYYNPSKVNPNWSKGVAKERIGRHVFLTI